MFLKYLDKVYLNSHVLIKNHGVNLLIISGLSVLFFIVNAAIVYLLTGRSLSDFVPGRSDNVVFYNLISTAIEHGIFSPLAGLNGYLWPGGIVTVAEWGYFSAHGMFILLPYIFFGNIFGWGGGTPLVIHIVLLTIAFNFVYFCTKSRTKTVLVQFFAFSFAPLLIYFNTMMMEIQMYAWAILIMAIFYAYVTQPKKSNQIGLLVAITLASSGRISNIFFMVPYFALELEKLILKKERFFKNGLYKGIITVIVIFILFWLNSRLSASFIVNFLSQMQGAVVNDGIAVALQMILDRFSYQIRIFVSLHQILIFAYLRYSIIGVSLVLLFNAFIEIGKSVQFRLNVESFALALMLVFIALFNIMFYDVGRWRDFRVMAPVFLGVVVYIIMRHDVFKNISKVAATIAVVSIIFISHVANFIPNYFGEFERNPYVHHMHFDHNAQSRWDNTVLVRGLQSDFWDLDVGIGVIYGLSWDLNFNELAGKGLRYILVPFYLENIDNYYEILASGDDWVVYRLRQAESSIY